MASFTTVLPGPASDRPDLAAAAVEVARRAAAAGVTGERGCVLWLGWAREWCVGGEVHPAGWGFRATFIDAGQVAA